VIEHARKLGIRTRIWDDAQYWRYRDKDKLVAELDRWNQMIAGFTGKLSDKFGSNRVVAPIKDRPDFEHLEAKDSLRIRKPLDGTGQN